MPRAGIEPAIPTTFSRTGSLVRAWPRSTSTIGSSRHIWNVLQREVKVFLRKETLRNITAIRSLVQITGLEPVRYFYQWILSPLRLPIPPHLHITCTPYLMCRVHKHMVEITGLEPVLIRS